MNYRARSRADQGQGKIEYALILVLIAVAVLSLLNVIGRRSQTALMNVSNGLKVRPPIVIKNPTPVSLGLAAPPYTFGSGSWPFIPDPASNPWHYNPSQYAVHGWPGSEYPRQKLFDESAGGTASVSFTVMISDETSG